MIEQYLNFDSDGTGSDFFGISRQRLDEFNRLFDSELCKEIEANADYYTYTDEDGVSLHAGRIIAFALQHAKTPNEQLAILFAARTIIENNAAKIRLKKRISAFFKKDKQ